MTVDAPDIKEQISEGKHLLKLGRFAPARQVFERVLSRNPQLVPALNGLAESYSGLGDLDSAESYSARAVRLAPTDAETLNSAGVILFRRGQYAKSEQALARALAADQNNPDSHANLLKVYGGLATQFLLDARQSRGLMESVEWLLSYGENNPPSDLMKLNHQLRDKVLNEFANKYASDRARILLHRPTSGALKYLMDSWAEVLNHMGIPTVLLNWGSSTREVFDSFRPTVFITVADPAYSKQLDVNYIDQYRARRKLMVGRIGISHRIEPTDFVITFHLDPANDPRFKGVDKPLVSVPYGINPRRHYMRPGRAVWDFAFVGCRTDLKAEATARYLMPIVKRYQGMLAGTNWPVGLGELSVAQAALMYNFAQVYPNFHLPWQYEQMDEINERAYIIPACGGFELVDNPAAMKRLFASDEMAVAKSSAEYHEMFAHYLSHPDERTPYVSKGMQRVFDEYTLFHRLSHLAEFLGVDEVRPPSTDRKPQMARIDAGEPSPTISAVLVTCNHSHELTRSLESLAAQDYPKLEVVVVDDGSTDDTQAVIEAFKDRLPNLVHKRNEQTLGMSESRRQAAALATGEFIIMGSDDDMLQPGALREFVRPLKDRPYDLLYADVQVLDADDRPAGVWRYRKYDDKWDALRHLVEKGANVVPEMHLVRRSVFNRYWSECSQVRNVSPIWLAAMDTISMHHVARPLCQYRVQGNRMFSNASTLLSRNKGVTNFLNAIMFRYSSVNLFQAGVGRPLRRAVGESILNLVRYLLVHGGKFVDGKFDNGHKFSGDDHYFAIYYEYAWHWLELAKVFLEDTLTINRLQENVLNEVGYSYDPVPTNQLPTVYRHLPWFAYRPQHDATEFVPFDMITVGDASPLHRNDWLILQDGDLSYRVSNTPVRTVEQLEGLLDTHVYQVINIFDQSQVEPVAELLQDAGLHFTYILDFTSTVTSEDFPVVNIHAVGNHRPANFDEYLALLSKTAGVSPWLSRYSVQDRKTVTAS